MLLALLFTRSCLTLWDPMDCSLPGFSVHRIFQAEYLEWVAMSYSRGASQPRDQTCISWSPALTGGFFTTVPPGKLSYRVCPLTFFPQLQRLLRVVTIKRELASSMHAVCGAFLALGVSVPVAHPEDGALASGRLADLSLQMQPACQWAPGTAGRGGRPLSSRLFELWNVGKGSNKQRAHELVSCI